MIQQQYNLKDGVTEIIFQQAPIGIYTINKYGAIDLSNPKFLEITGSDTRNIIGLNVIELPSYKESGLDKFIQNGLSGKAFETELKHLSFFGKKETWRRYHGVPIFEADGKTVEHLLLLVEDVTERKDLELKLDVYTKELEKAKTGLEETVAKRTEELSKKLAEIEQTNQLMIDREFRIAGLKKENEELRKKLGDAIAAPEA